MLSISLGKLGLILTTLVLSAILANSAYYEISERETGWSTGLRESSNATMELSGLALGDGTYYRYTDMDFNDVIMRERISTSVGAMDTAESIYLHSDITNPITSTLNYFPGNIYIWTVEEIWPVTMVARRDMDYIGRGINDREVFINNEDCTSTSFLRATDLKKRRASFMELEDVHFILYANDSTDTILEDRFLPDKYTFYNIDSTFNGTAELRYREASDRNTAQEGLEVYQGNFRLARRIIMENSGLNGTERNETQWLPCFCPLMDVINASYVETKAFGV